MSQTNHDLLPLPFSPLPFPCLLLLHPSPPLSPRARPSLNHHDHSTSTHSSGSASQSNSSHLSAFQHQESSLSARRSSSPQAGLPSLTVQRPSHPTELAPIRPGAIQSDTSFSPKLKSPLFRRASSGIHLPTISPTGSPLTGARATPLDTETGAKNSSFTLPRIKSPFLIPRPPSLRSSDSGGSDSTSGAPSRTMSTSNSPDRSRMDTRPDLNNHGSRQPSPSGVRPPFPDIYGPGGNRSSPFRMGPPGEVSRTLAPLPMAGYERRGSASGVPPPNRDQSSDRKDGRIDAEAEEARDQVGDPADFDYSMRRHSIAVFQGEEGGGPLRPLSGRPPVAPSPLNPSANTNGHGADDDAARLAMNRKRKESHDRAAMGYFGDSHNPNSNGDSNGRVPSAAPVNHVFQPPAPPTFSNPFASSSASANIPPEEFGPPTKRRGSTYDAKMRQLSLSGTHDVYPAGPPQNASPQPWNPLFQNDRRDSTVSVYSNRSLASSMGKSSAKHVVIKLTLDLRLASPEQSGTLTVSSLRRGSDAPQSRSELSLLSRSAFHSSSCAIPPIQPPDVSRLSRQFLVRHVNIDRHARVYPRIQARFPGLQRLYIRQRVHARPDPQFAAARDEGEHRQRQFSAVFEVAGIARVPQIGREETEKGDEGSV